MNARKVMFSAAVNITFLEVINPYIKRNQRSITVQYEGFPCVWFVHDFTPKHVNVVQVFQITANVTTW